MRTAPTQKEMILRHLQSGESITPAQAVAEYGCYRLAAVIFDLRADYPEIYTHDESAVNRFGVTVHYARYRMPARPQVIDPDLCAWCKQKHKPGDCKNAF